MAFISARTKLGWVERVGKLGTLGTLPQIMNTIQTTEGANPQFNNPGNLIYGSIAKQFGGVPTSKCFTDTNTGGQDCIAQFPTLQAGSDAEALLIQNLAASGMTIQQFANTYAPAGSGNNPTAYAQYLAQATGLSVNDPLSLAIAADQTPPPFVGPVLPPGWDTGMGPIPVDTPVDVGNGGGWTEGVPVAAGGDPSGGTGGASGVNWGVVAGVLAGFAVLMAVTD